MHGQGTDSSCPQTEVLQQVEGPQLQTLTDCATAQSLVVFFCHCVSIAHWLVITGPGTFHSDCEPGVCCSFSLRDVLLLLEVFKILLLSCALIAAAAVVAACVLTRDVPPTAMLLRSGDAVVLGQEARSCYHGVPRVLTDRPLPEDLLAAAEQHGGRYQSHVQHMQGCRINISIRSTC